MLKIYFNDKPLFVSTEHTEEMQPFLDNKNTVLLKSIEPEEIKKLISALRQSAILTGVLIYNEKQALEALKKHFLLIQAAGGLVCTTSEEFLLIYRKDKWDLPKGKLDEGEDLEECAVREVEEETGLQNISLKQPLCITYHTYHQDGRHILKESHWYLMQTGKNQVFTPQTDEDIEKCEWVSIEKLAPYMENTHPSILDVVKEGINLIRKEKITTQ